MKFLRILAIGFIVLPFSCNKSADNRVPSVGVDITLFINDPQLANLTVTGGWEYITGGSKGLIVYRSDINSFNAYERHSPYQVSQQCVVVVDASNILINDPCSDSQWLIQDGSLSRGPASQALRQYNTYFDGSVLRITN